LCPGGNLDVMVEKMDEGKCGSRRAHDKIAGPETNAEKAEEKIFCESQLEGRIVSGVRTKIDKRK
jgi:hypothetical protein